MQTNALNKDDVYSAKYNAICYGSNCLSAQNRLLDHQIDF